MIRTENLVKSFDGKKLVLNGITETIEKKEKVVVIGPSGSGKSTLLHILGGVDKPTSGKVYLDGQDVYAQNEDQLAIFRRRQVGLIYQFYNLIPVLNVTENISLPVLMDGKKVDKNYLRELIDLLSLTGREKHLPNELSGGQQQRVAIARAIINNPSVIFADEPSGNLDSQTKGEIHRLFFDLRDLYGQTIIIVTHDNELAQMSNRILKMKDGLFI